MRAVSESHGPVSAIEAVVAGMTIGELARCAGTSVETVVAAALGSGAPLEAGRSVALSRGRALPSGARVRRGEPSIYKVTAVLAAASKPISFREIQTRVGGTAAQVRAILWRLSEAGRLKITGQRRGTRYAAS